MELNSNVAAQINHAITQDASQRGDPKEDIVTVEAVIAMIEEGSFDSSRFAHARKINPAIDAVLGSPQIADSIKASLLNIVESNQAQIDSISIAPTSSSASTRRLTSFSTPETPSSHFGTLSDLFRQGSFSKVASILGLLAENKDAVEETLAQFNGEMITDLFRVGMRAAEAELGLTREKIQEQYDAAQGALIQLVTSSVAVAAMTVSLGAQAKKFHSDVKTHQSQGTQVEGGGLSNGRPRTALDGAGVTSVKNPLMDSIDMTEAAEPPSSGSRARSPTAEGSGYVHTINPLTDALEVTDVPDTPRSHASAERTPRAEAAAEAGERFDTSLPEGRDGTPGTQASRGPRSVVDSVDASRPGGRSDPLDTTNRPLSAPSTGVAATASSRVSGPDAGSPAGSADVSASTRQVSGVGPDTSRLTATAGADAQSPGGTGAVTRDAENPQILARQAAVGPATAPSNPGAAQQVLSRSETAAGTPSAVTGRAESEVAPTRLDAVTPRVDASESAARAPQSRRLPADVEETPPPAQRSAPESVEGDVDGAPPLDGGQAPSLDERQRPIDGAGDDSPKSLAQLRENIAQSRRRSAAAKAMMVGRLSSTVGKVTGHMGQSTNQIIQAKAKIDRLHREDGLDKTFEYTKAYKTLLEQEVDNLRSSRETMMKEFSSVIQSIKDAAQLQVNQSMRITGSQRM